MSKVQTSGPIKSGLLAIALSLGAVAAYAQPMMPHGGPGAHGGPGGPGAHGEFGGGRMEHMLDAVDATDAQHAQIKKIMQAAQADLKTQHETMRTLHEQSLALLAAPKIDAAAIEALRVKQNAVHEQVSKRMSQAMIDAAGVLTPEQRAKLAEKMKKYQARMAEAMKERGVARP